MSQHGSITVSPTGEIVAGSILTLTFTYTVGPLGMEQDGSLRIATPNDDWEWPRVPMHRYFQRGHERGGYDDGYCSYARRNVSVELQSDSAAWIDLEAQECSCVGDLQGNWARHLIAIVRDGDLVEGDVVTVVYGDTTWGEDGIRAQRVAPTPDDHFRAYVDVTGEREFVELPSEKLRKLTVVPGPATHFNVVAPAIVRPGQSFQVRIGGMDDFRNRPASPFVGVLRFPVRQPDMRAIPWAATGGSDGGSFSSGEVSATTEGVHQLHVEPPGGTRSSSNPIWCTNRDLNLYFGDLHCQSQWHSDSVGTPDENYEYGRDVAGLDFMAITDSGGWRKEGWLDTQEAANRHNESGEFVALKGFEYGASVGHRNVIYRDCAVEPPLEDLPNNDPKGLFDYYRSRDVLIIPHHTKVWTEWDYHDPELEPIVEAYSCWGSGVEREDPLWHKSIKPGSGVFAALDRGYRFGFIGSGDSHAGMPGRSYPADRFWCVNAKSGFACVYATELTREAIFDALRQRHCYATTGARMILEFSVNDSRMGSEVEVEDPEQPRLIRAHVIGTDELSLLRVVKNNEELTRRRLSGDEEFFEYHDTTPAQDGDFYYVRVVQRDENTAWSSPVWVRTTGEHS